MPIVITYVLGLLTALSVPVFAEDLREGSAVTFTLVRPAAQEVSLAGTFNQWDPGRHRLAGPDGRGRWTITIPLAPGRYEYLFVIDAAEWATDPSAPSVSDGLGGRNSVLLVREPGQ